MSVVVARSQVSMETSMLVLEFLGLQGFSEVTKATSLCRAARSDTRLWLFSKTLYVDRNPLMFAAFKGHLERLDFLINLDYDIDQQCNRGYTALMWAIKGGQFDSARLLLLKTANMYHLSKTNCNALLLAILNNHLEFINLLCSFGLQSFQGSLNACLRLGLIDTARNLLARGATPDSINVGTMIAHKRTNSTLMWALSVDKATGTLFETYLSDINYIRRDGTTALMLACHYGNLKAVEKLLALGANDSRRTDGLGPLLWACQTKNNTQVIKALLRSGFDIDVHNNGKSALYYAIAIQDLNMITLLCSRHIDVYNSMHFMLSYFSSESMEIARILTSHGAIVHNNDIEQFLLFDYRLIELFLDLESINPAAILAESKKTILEVSIYRRHESLTYKLLGIFETWDVSKKTEVYNGCLAALIHSNTPLLDYICPLVSQKERTKAFHLALVKENVDAVETIISYGVNIDVAVKVDDHSCLEGLNALMLACELNNPKLILLMINLGLSDIHNFYDNRTNTTIMNVSRFCDPKHARYEECMYALKSRGFEIYLLY